MNTLYKYFCSQMIYPLGLLISLFIGSLYFVMPLNFLIALLLGFLFILFIYNKLELGLGLFIASMLYEKDLPFLEMSLTKIMGFPIITVCLLKILIKGYKPKFHREIDSTMFVLYLWMIVSLFYATNTQIVQTSLITYLQLIINYLIIKTIIRDENQLKDIIKYTIIFSTIMICINIYELIQNPILVATSQYVDRNRTLGTSDDPNKLAHALVFALPFATYLFLNKSKLFLISIAVFSLTIFSTFSRGGIIGLFFVFIFAIYEINKKYKKKGLILSAIFLLLFACSFMLLNKGNKLLNRIQTIQTLSGNSINTRIDMLYTAVDMSANNPLTGVGLNNFMENSHLYGTKNYYQMAAHNAYLDVLATLGIPGLLLLIFIIYYSFKNLTHYKNYIQKTDDNTENLILLKFIQITLICYLIPATFLSLLPRKLFWVIIAFTEILYHIANENEKNKIL